jgi:AcrR family transcriptional regulator
MTDSLVEQKILKAAQNTFLLYGFHGTTIQKIAVKAEVNKSLIHYYFRSKEKLYMLILGEVIDYIGTTDFTKKHFQEKNLNVKWFLFTELYNNQALFNKSLKEYYVRNGNKSLIDIKEFLKFVETLQVYSTEIF